MSSRSKIITPIQSVVAGAAAGGVESIITYPTEYVKTTQQLLRGQHSVQPSPLKILISTIRHDGLSRLYTGGTIFCISNAAKSGVRFLAFDSALKIMPKDASGKTTVMGNLAAGLCAGVAESVAVLTPGETVKTKMIDDTAGARQYRSTAQVIRSILASEGPLGFFRGVWPVTLKQSSNAMVRFTSYGFLSSTLKPIFAEYGMAGARSPVAGALAGVLTVYCTMPFDNIKTQLQSIDGRRLYRGSWDCAKRLVQHGGIRLLWKGTTPRLVRLSVSGAISFSVYEAVVDWTARLTATARHIEMIGDV